jgi:type III pantothenate kinase
VILADVGNTHVHIYEKGRVLHLELEDAIEAFGERILYYICVDLEARKAITAETYWRDLEPRIDLPGAYEGMGVDRRALCLSREEGLFVDAGSALTVDRVVGGRYKGGMILPGLHAYRRAFAAISPVLDREPDWSLHPASLPKGTVEQLSYGIIAPIYHEILRVRGGLPL